jgi:ferredoxin
LRVKADLDLCQGHAMCQLEAPEVFRVARRADGYDQVELILAEPREDLRPQVEAALRFCPNRALRIEEGD